VKPKPYERHFLTASLYELFNGRLNDFRGTAAVWNLKRVGIEATCEKLDERFVCVSAIATTEKHITYLEIRGYQIQKPKRTKKTKPKPAAAESH